ncbi:MAG TPA: hypothetical protein GX502_08030 [Syntrophaceticus sp.]|jgi:hypothetical protein|nr:hypothetical protein [Syntrophaceticus sp.]
MVESKDQVVEKLVEVFFTYSDCIISRINYMKENADIDNKTPFTAPFEQFSSHVESLCRVGEKIINMLLDKS